MNTRNLTTRFLSMLLVLVMVFGMVPFQAFAADNAQAVDATIIFTDLHTSSSDYKESTVKGIMTAFKNSGLPFSSVTSGGDSFSSNESSYTGYTDTLTGYIRSALGTNVPVSYLWSDHDRGAVDNSSSKTPLDKTSRLVYGAGNDGVYGTADDGNYYVYALSMADLCTYDRYSTGFNYTASSNNRAKNGYTSTVPQAIENFLNDAAVLHKDRPLFIVSHQPLFDNRNDNGWAEDWCNAINEVGNEMDIAFFYGHNHKYDSGSDYYYAKGSTMPVATRKFTDGNNWNYNYQVGSGWQYDKDLASVNKVLNFTHMCAGYLSPATESGTTRKATAMAIAIYPDSIRYTTYNSSGVYTGNYAVDKIVPREFAVTEPEEPVVPSEPEATEPPVSDKVEGEKVYVLVDAPVDGGKYLIVNQTLTNGDLSKDWDSDDDGMAVIRNGEAISYSYAIPKAGTITDANGNVYTGGYIEYSDENAVWTVHASGKAWTIENDGYYLNKASENGVSATRNSLTWNYTANGDDSRLYNGSDYLYFTYYGGERDSWRWRTGTESGTSSTRDIFFYQEVVVTAPDTEPDPTPEARPDSSDVVVGDGSYSFVKVDAASSLQEGYYQLHNNYTSKYLTNTKTSNANRLNLDTNGQNHIWYIKPVSGGYTIQYGGPTGQYLNFAHQSASVSNNAQTVQILNTNGYWGIGATSGNPVAYLAREGSSNTSGSAHGYASNDYKYPGDVGMDWNLYQRVENRKTYSVSASDVHHYLGQNGDQVQLTYALLVNGAAGTLPAGGSWNFSAYEDVNGIVKNISASGIITFNKVEGSCFIKIAYTWSEGTAYMYVKVTAERDPNVCEHSYESVTVNATCTADGSVTYTCTCGDSYVEVIKSTGHDYKATVTAPTCTEEGFTTYTCACGDTYTADHVEALGHSYKSVTVNATCTTDGSITYTCTCGDSYVEVIKATGHDYKATVTAPTCTEEGFTTYTCACGDTYTADQVEALGHTYKSVTVDATCTADGSVTYTCHCGDTYAEVIKATGHDHKAVVTAPTCTEAGYTTYTCACGDTYTADVVAALGHAHKATVTAPTCTASGYTTYSCTCGDSYTTDRVAALGHSYTCVDHGDSLVYTCSNCGNSYTEILAREWVKAGAAYVLDTDGIDIGSNHKYVVVGATQDYAMTLEGDKITPTQVTIEGNVLTWDKADKNAFYFYSNTSREKNSYLLTQDSSKSIYHVSSELKYGHDSKGYWYFGSSSNGTYQLYDYDSSANWYMNYGYAWNNESVSRFAASSSARSVRLFKYTDVYARLAGSLHQTCTTADGATADSVLKKLNIETSANGSTVSGTVAVTASMVSWNTAFNGNVPGVYTAAVSYQGVALGTMQVTVSDDHNYVSQVIAPTCTAEGYTLHTCTDCGYTRTDAVTEPLGHDHSCVESAGYLHYTCTRCGDAYSVKAVTYTKASGIANGERYVIAMYSGSKYYALSHAGNTLTAVEISVSNGEIISEISQDLLWDYRDNRLGYEENGTTYRLYGQKVTTKTGTLNISTSQSSSVSFSSNRLKINNQYLRYINGSISLNASAANTYMFVEQ